MTPHRGRGGPIDWTGLRSRVEAAARAVAGSDEPAPELAAALLQERARALARPPVEQVPGGTVRLVTFAVGGVRYGVEPARVREMFRAGRVVPLPGAEPWVVGLSVWRGDLVLAVDLGLLLGARPVAISERPSLLVVGDERYSLALVADGAGDVETMAAGELRPPPEDAGGRELIRGVSSQAVLVLDLDRLLGMVGQEPA